MRSIFVSHASEMQHTNPAGIFDSASVLLNQNVNRCVCTYVNHSRTVAEWIKPYDWFRIGSGLVRPWTDIILVQDWFGRRSLPAGTEWLFQTQKNLWRTHVPRRISVEDMYNGPFLLIMCLKLCNQTLVTAKFAHQKFLAFYYLTVKSGTHRVLLIHVTF